MAVNDENSLGGEATFAGKGAGPQRADVSLGDEQTLGGGDAAGLDTVIDDIEVVDLEARYRPEGTIGQGGMGAVVLATDTRLDRKVAIKRIIGEAARSRTAVMRFLTEAKAIAALNHPNIVQIYDYGRTKDGPFLIMEFVDGGSLLDACKSGPLPLEKAVDIVCQICDGLGAAHEQGIVHRDIKPANILLNRTGLPKLTDFGLAKAENHDHGMTMAGAVMGTPDFMPPEQRRDASLVDHRSDLWSLAATFYQMVTGRSPKIIRLRDVPTALQPVLEKALEDSQDQRYQSAADFREAIRMAVGLGGGKAAIQQVSLVEGQCPGCGTLNTDVGRKFCRQCQAALRTPCLQCDKDMPVWDAVCGECGGRQSDVAETRQADLIRRQLQAKDAYKRYDFPEAIAIGEQLASLRHSRLGKFAEWGRTFLTAVKEQQSRLAASAAERLAEARAHRQAFDYAAAIRAIESIPAPLRDSDTQWLLAECRSNRDESAKLLEEISRQIKAKDLDGLLPKVERALAILAKRADLQQLQKQLRRREAKLSSVGRDTSSTKDGSSLLPQVAAQRKSNQRLFQRAIAGVRDRVSVYKYVLVIAGGLIVAVAAGLMMVLPGARGTALAILKTPPILNSIGMKLKLLPGGTFTMGRAGGVAFRGLVGASPHKVTITRPFYIGVYEVTNAQWKSVMGSMPSEFTDADQPVETVSWNEANEFCQKLSTLPEERKAGRAYRLPTEAEWEYACRAGTTTDWSFGDDLSRLDEYAWCSGNSGLETHPIGRKKPNSWGLFDMHGNVGEWCNDWYAVYGNGHRVDPQGPLDGSERVWRGSTYAAAVAMGYHGRSAERYQDDPSARISTIGFRIAMQQRGARSNGE